MTNDELAQHLETKAREWGEDAIVHLRDGWVTEWVYDKARHAAHLGRRALTMRAGMKEPPL